MKTERRGWAWPGATGALAALLLAPALLLVRPGASWLLAFVPLVLLLQAWAGGWEEVLPSSALNPAILLLALMLLASLWITPDLALSLPKIAGLLLGLTVFFTVLRYTPTRGAWNGALLGFSGLGGGIALAGLAGTQWFTTKLIVLNELTAHLPQLVSGLPGAPSGIHPNILAGTLLWLLPATVCSALALGGRPGWFAPPAGAGRMRLASVGAVLLGLAAALMAGVLALAQSRSAYLAAALTGILLVLALLPQRIRWPALGLALLALAAGLWLANRYAGEGGLAGLLDTLPAGEGALSTVTFAQRLEIWSRAQWAIRDNPLTGLGMDVFRVAMPLLYPLLTYNPADPIAHAHNELLQAALDLGLPGLIAFLALNLGAFAMLARLLREGGAVRLLALGLGGGLLAHFLFGLVDAAALGGRPGVVFWLLLGLIASLYRLAIHGEGQEAAHP